MPPETSEVQSPDVAPDAVDTSATLNGVPGAENMAASESAAAPTGLLIPDRADQPSMKRVMDVPLTVTLRFGQRQLTLRELLELNTGSLVELDQQVEEPVLLMLGERVIARGEVVIVDGNYGMRVLEVVERYAGQFGSLRCAS